MTLLELARSLIEKPSVTPDDAGCQDLIASQLQPFGYQIVQQRFGDVDNLWAIRGDSGPIFAFVGHTDVVPAGPSDLWQRPPFQAIVEGDFLYGRGAADMKGSVAAMVKALQRLAKRDFPGRLALLLTSDEEGPAKDGIQRMLPWLASQGTQIDFALVGEPSSQSRLGDIIRVGRRGSLNLDIEITGKQGHVAYPQLADNAVHNAIQALAPLTEMVWDQGNDVFPPTSFQISNIRAGEGADNIIPGTCHIQANFRFSPESSVTQLKTGVTEILQRAGVQFHVNWRLSGLPFLTEEKTLIDAVQSALLQHCGQVAAADTGGGTSDGRFLSPHGAEVVELGPLNATIHQANECVSISDLSTLVKVYETAAARVFESV